MFSVGALHEKGVTLDLLANPPILHDGNDAFPISMEVSRMFVLQILLDGQEEPDEIPQTAVDTDAWHRKMGPCRPRGLKRPAEKLSTGVNDIDRSGAGTPSAIGYNKPDDSRTDETVDLGTAKLTIGTGIDPNVIAGTFILTQDMTTSTRTVLKTYGITDTCPTKMSAEVRPAQIAEDPVLSTEDTTLLRSAEGSLPSLSRCMTVGLIYSEDAGDGYYSTADYLTADVDADQAGDMEKACSTTGVVARMAGASVD